MEGLLAFFEQVARRLVPHRKMLGIIGLFSLGGLTEALWLQAGLHQLFYFVVITWSLGLNLLIPIYFSEEGNPSWIRRSSEIIQSTMAFFTALWYIILLMLSIGIIIKLVFT